MTNPFPAANDVETSWQLLKNRGISCGVILKIGVHRNDDFFPASRFKSSRQRSRLPEISSQSYATSV